MTHDQMTHDQAIPTLPSRDLVETVNFYRQLGFESCAAQDYQSDYVILQRGSLELHFFKMAEIAPTESYAGCYLRVGSVDTLAQEFQQLGLPSKGIPRLGTVADKPWGMREFYLVDPSGNLLRIGQATALR